MRHDNTVGADESARAKDGLERFGGPHGVPIFPIPPHCDRFAMVVDDVVDLVLAAIGDSQSVAW